MPPTRTQSHREFAVTTPLGDDVLLFKRMSYHEDLGRPFVLSLELTSEDPAIKAEDLLGQNVTVRCELPNSEGETRYFNGIVADFSQGATEEGQATYSLRLVPWLWFLTRTSDCRMFQEMTAPDIIKQVFRDLGFTDFEENLTGEYRVWEYCVQYRETAFDFVSRIMEQEGIYFYFKHENGAHTLVMMDDAASHEAYPGYEEIRFRPYDRVLGDSEFIEEFRVSRSVQPGAYAQTDYDFKKPTKDLMSKSASARSHDLAEFELFDYPGEYVEASEGDRYSSVRLDERQCQHHVAHGSGDSRGIAAGRTFKLIDHPIEASNAEYMVTTVTIEAESDSYGSTGSVGEGRDHKLSATFSAILASEQFRPVRVTHLPFVRGPQTAVVVGPSGEEIHTDEHGRVKVMFHWDREAKADETSSCWIRVSQEFAGKKWGSMQIPRVGHEVIVSFLEGDPDRPIITGRVYNGDNAPPYDPKQFGTIATWKTNSSKGGGGFNELRFEDKKDEEQIFLHAQKNLDIRVLNDRFETVVNNRHLIVENNKFEHVKNERNEQVDSHHKELVKKDRSRKVEGMESVEIGKEHSLKVGKDVAEEFGNNASRSVTKDYYIKAKNICIEADENVTIKVGQSSLAITKDGLGLKTTGDIKEEATKSITMKATKDIKGTATANVDLSATANITLKGTGGATLEGTGPTAVKSAAITEVKGSLVKIN